MIALIEFVIAGIATLIIAMWALVAAIDADAEKKSK